MMELNLESMPFKELPIGLCLRKLEYLNLLFCGNLTHLPSNFVELTSLRYLMIGFCHKLASLPQLPPSIGQLYATCCSSLEIVQFTSTAGDPLYRNMISIDLGDCLKLDEHSCNAVELTARLNLRNYAFKAPQEQCKILTRIVSVLASSWETMMLGFMTLVTLLIHSVVIQTQSINEAELVEQVAKSLSTKLNRIYLGDSRNNLGTETIQSIFSDEVKFGEILSLNPQVFARMHKLKFLKMPSGLAFRNTENVDLGYLPYELRFLHWHYYPLKSLPMTFSAKYLFELDLSSSKVEKLWDWDEVKVCKCGVIPIYANEEEKEEDKDSMVDEDCEEDEIEAFPPAKRLK
ncbi:disease resistance protein RML1A [Senna tora]|uniref:Disease resistance protein RML1A n=1 Tax=Senna tora TaxID=362788 RepID=A0A834T2H1_9FABA|nr:disease resistance protein RML1A [Senna tora]